MAREIDNLSLMLVQKPTMYGEKASRVLITDPLAGGAQCLMRHFGARSLCPALPVEYGTALRTRRRVRQLAFRLIRVVDLFVDETVLPALSRHRTLRRLLHIGFLSSVCGPVDKDSGGICTW
jgi:hypothetical protein